ncbi:MAG: CsbD family protein [Solirubrobacterales bacterium]
MKEAAGDISGDTDLQREGKVDQAGGKAKHGVERLTDKVKDLLHKD